MRISVDIKPEDDILYAKVSGPFDLARGRELYTKIVTTAADNKKNKILIDITEMEGYANNPIVERFTMASFIGETQTKGTRIAFIFSEEQMLEDKFDENVARNRSGLLITTTDPREALEWLNGND